MSRLFRCIFAASLCLLICFTPKVSGSESLVPNRPCLKDYLSNYSWIRPKEKDLKNATAETFTIPDLIKITENHPFDVKSALQLVKLSEEDKKMLTEVLAMYGDDYEDKGLKYRPQIRYQLGHGIFWWSIVVMVILGECFGCFVLFKKLLEYRNACARYEFE